MTQKFVDIKMTGLNEGASRRVEVGSAIMRMSIDLSASAPSEWAQYFNDRWKQHFYMVKRAATVSGRSLHIECVPEELEKDHLPELKKVIAETNQAYANYVGQRQRALDVRAQRDADDAAKLAEIKGKLNFD